MREKGLPYWGQGVNPPDEKGLPFCPEGSTLCALGVRSKRFGEDLEKDWAWCDVLVLPTLSENFGLVVAEALERGKRVITTDGAPAWEPPEAAVPSAQCLVPSADGRLIYLKGFRDGTDAERVRLLKDALEKVSG